MMIRINNSLLAIVVVLLTEALSIVCSAQKVVLLDNFYNHETSTKTGKPFHYLWEDTEMSGFSQFGELFQQKGFKLATLREKPDAKNLKTASIYIIVDPDTPQETSQPNYMDEMAATTIAEWVKNGGVLLLFTNDCRNAELDHFNLLAAKFGMRFSNLLLHPEKSEAGKPRNFNSCASTNFPKHPLFTGVSKIFLKEISSIECTNTARPILVEDGQVLMAEASYGKGTVFAVGDPLFYNEYIDHLMLPSDFDNLKVANNLVDFVIKKNRH